MKKNLSVIALAAALASCDAGNGKNDIIGFQLGMKKDAVHALADSNHWTCDNNSKTGETCYTMSGQMRVAYASHLRRIWKVPQWHILSLISIPVSKSKQ